MKETTSAPEEVTEDLTPHEDGSGKKVAPALMMDDRDADNEISAKHEAEIEAAYAVKPFFWHDIKLAPFAIDREGDWKLHRELLDAPALHDIIQIPSAMTPDALRVIWFLAHDPSEWLDMPGTKLEKDTPDDEGRWVRLTSKERAVALEKKIREWGSQHVSPPEGTMLVALFYDIYQSAHITRATSKPSEHRNEQRSKN